jgi:hypothetical protein
MNKQLIKDYIIFYTEMTSIKFQKYGNRGRTLDLFHCEHCGKYKYMNISLDGNTGFCESCLKVSNYAKETNPKNEEMFKNFKR